MGVEGVSEDGEGVGQDMNGDIECILTETMLRSLAGETIFKRGEAYQQAGAVEALCLTKGLLTAIVQGTDDYCVALWPENGNLQYECNCPMGMNRVCCKHIVATGLAWLLQQQEPSRESPQQSPRGNSSNQQRKQKSSFPDPQTKAAVMDWLSRQTTKDSALRHSSEYRQHFKLALDIGELKEIVRAALRSKRHPSWQGEHQMVQSAWQVVHLLDVLKFGRQTIEAATLADYAVECAIRTYMKMDDSSGAFNN